MGENFISLLLAGGGGSVIGSVITAFIQTWGKRGQDRASAADLSVSAAGKIIIRLEKENKAMRHAIIFVTNAIDEIVSENGFSVTVKQKLRKLNTAARKALSIESD